MNLGGKYMAWKKGKQRAESTIKKLRKLTDEQRQEAIKLYLSGLSTNKVAKHFGCGDEAIRRILIDENIPRRSKSEAVKLGSASPESRRKRSESHKGIKYPPISEETRKKRSENMKKMWENPEFRERRSAYLKESIQGENNPFYGKSHSSKTKEIIGKKAAKRFENHDYKVRVTDAINRARNTISWKKKQSIARKKLWQTSEFKEKAMVGLANQKGTSIEIKVMEYLQML
jgi:transposase-like protein